MKTQSHTPIVRILQATDAEAFLSLRLRGLREEPTAFASSFEEERELGVAAMAARLGEQAAGVVFGAFHDDALVGLVGVRRDAHVKLAHRALLWGMYVAPEARRLRLGRALIEAALTHARETLRVRQVILGVAADNHAAIALYEASGFESFGIEPDYMHVDGEYRAEMHMIRFLDGRRSARNRSMPATTVIPVLAYPDVRAAVEWLCRCFGFEERLRIGEHRAQLSCGEGALVVARARDDAAEAAGHSIMIRVANVDAHYRRAIDAGARVSSPPADFPYGERQYSVADLAGHVWTFSQTIADVDPASWGGELLRAR